MCRIGWHRGSLDSPPRVLFGHAEETRPALRTLSVEPKASRPVRSRWCLAPAEGRGTTACACCSRRVSASSCGCSLCGAPLRLFRQDAKDRVLGGEPSQRFHRSIRAHTAKELVDLPGPLLQIRAED